MEDSMEQKTRKLRLPWKQKVTVSRKVPMGILLVLFGMIPMMLCAKTVISSGEQTQTESRMIEVQNQCQILSNKITRTGYLKGDRDGTVDHAWTSFMLS